MEEAFQVEALAESRVKCGEGTRSMAMGNRADTDKEGLENTTKEITIMLSTQKGTDDSCTID